jgi:hypothetical protein
VAYLRVVHEMGDCLVEEASAQELARDLQGLSSDAYPDAVAAAIIIEGALTAAENGEQVTFNEPERHALIRVLTEWRVTERPFSEGLSCLEHALKIDTSTI